jgi:protein TonB
MNYFKAFCISFIVHTLAIAAFFFLAANIHVESTKKVIDLSAMLIEPAPEPESEPAPPPPPPPPPVTAPPPPVPVPPTPVPVIAPVLEEPPLPTERYVEATEESVAPVDGYSVSPEVFQYEPAPETAPGAGVVSTVSARTAEENELRINYIKRNYNYIQNLIKRKLIYPQEARRMGIWGSVSVIFTINADGTVSNVSVEQSSGYDILDREAVNAVQNASPYPKPPLAAKIAIPIDFKLRQ